VPTNGTPLPPIAENPRETRQSPDDGVSRALHFSRSISGDAAAGGNVLPVRPVKCQSAYLLPLTCADDVIYYPYATLQLSGSSAHADSAAIAIVQCIDCKCCCRTLQLRTMHLLRHTHVLLCQQLHPLRRCLLRPQRLGARLCLRCSWARQWPRLPLRHQPAHQEAGQIVCRHRWLRCLRTSYCSLLACTTRSIPQWYLTTCMCLMRRPRPWCATQCRPVCVSDAERCL
jgi:hypothetical protein